MLTVSMLYAFFKKFGDALSKNKLKEVMTKTEIGRTIRDEALKEGEAKGKAEILTKQLMKKFKTLPDEYKNKIKGLSEDTLEIIVPPRPRKLPDVSITLSSRTFLCKIANVNNFSFRRSLRG